jgi:hypothetical protein
LKLTVATSALEALGETQCLGAIVDHIAVIAESRR